MSLSPRERRTVIIGVAIVVLVAGYTWVLKPLLGTSRGLRPAAASSRRSLFADASTRIIRYASVRRELESLGRSLNVEVPDDSPSDQIKRFVQRLEYLSGKARVRINNIQQLRSRARRGVARTPSRVELRLDLAGQNFASIVRFLDSLEQEPIPIAFDQVTITTTGASRSSGKAPPAGRPPGRSSSRGRQIQAAIKIHTYLFPKKAVQ